MISVLIRGRTRFGKVSSHNAQTPEYVVEVNFVDVLNDVHLARALKPFSGRGKRVDRGVDHANHFHDCVICCSEVHLGLFHVAERDSCGAKAVGSLDA